MDAQGIDFAAQIRRVHRLVDARGADVRTGRAPPPAEVVARHGLTRRGEGEPEVIVSEQVAAELGKPPAATSALVLTTRGAEGVVDGRIRCLGRPLSALTPAGGPWGYAQLILIAVEGEEPDPFGLATTGSLSARLPGLMSRASGDRLWLRFSHPLVQTGFDLAELGAVLTAAYRLDHPRLRAVEVVLVAGDPDALEALAPVAAEVGVLTGRQRKLHLVGEGELECDDLDCENCDHREVCDLLEDVRVRYRKRRAG